MNKIQNKRKNSTGSPPLDQADLASMKNKIKGRALAGPNHMLIA